MLDDDIRVELRSHSSSKLGLSRTLSRIFRESGAEPQVYLVVLTGGPCAGKSTALSTVQQRLEGHGFGVFALPEVASMMFNAGADWSQFAGSEQGLALYQTELARIQIEHEERFMELARSTSKPSVLICDRGVFDGKAFCTPTVWRTVLANLGFDEGTLMKRYDAVIHMVTAANGAEAFYNKDNPARRENPQQACEVDQLLRQCWAEHSGLTIVDNHGKTFSQKIQDVTTVLYKLVGIDPHGFIPRRFLVNVSGLHTLNSLFPLSICPTEFQVMDIFFSPMKMLRQRKAAGINYLRLEREMVNVQDEEVLIERIHRLRQEEFDASLLAAKQQEVRVLHKWVLHFECAKQSWEIHLYKETQTCVLAVETDDDGPLCMPDFLLPHLGPEIPKANTGEFEDYAMATLKIGPETNSNEPGVRLEALTEEFEASMRSSQGRPMSPPNSPDSKKTAKAVAE